MQITFKPIDLILTTLTIALFYGCSGHALQDLVDGKTSSKSPSEEAKSVPPSQNKALNSISPSSGANDKHAEDRYLQKSTDRWLQEDWIPLTKSNTSVTQTTKNNNTDTNTTLNNENNKTRTSNDINSTGLQYYVDKAGIYMENKKRRDANKTKPPSHTEKINAMPGIGKTKSRR